MKEFPIIENAIAFPILLQKEYSNSKEATNILDTLHYLEAEFSQKRDAFKDIYIHVKLAGLLLDIASLKEISTCGNLRQKFRFIAISS